MQSKKRFKLTPTPIVLLFILTALLVLVSGCAVHVKDMQFCSPIPGNLGAVCDNFLSSNQLILDQAGWAALQAKWALAGNAVECTTSQTLGDIKSEIEKLCSVARCDYRIQQKVIQGLNKLQALGKNQTLDVRQ